VTLCKNQRLAERPERILDDYSVGEDSLGCYHFFYHMAGIWKVDRSPVEMER
jgi:hypothetical protein